uniref:Uncharacterized protein n=1 Tax=Quercus lobata TaxID=97700 RepID=A0A7N2MXM9_QUELO
MRARMEFEHMVELMEQKGNQTSQVNFISCLTRICSRTLSWQLKRTARKLGRLSPEINAQKKNLLAVGGGSEGPDPREIESYLEEILSLMQYGIHGLTRRCRIDSMTTSMLDDVFYVLQSCLQRAISHLQYQLQSRSVVAVLSGANSLLSHEPLQHKTIEPHEGLHFIRN